MKRMIVLIQLLIFLGLPSFVMAVDILSPAQGQVFSPGESVEVRVAPELGEIIQTMTVIGRAGEVEGTIAGGGEFIATILIPIKAVGPEFLVVMGELVSGRKYASYVRVQSDPGTLLAIQVEALPVLKTPGQIYQLKVFGSYPDGIPRKIHDPSKGTTYQSDNQAILGVNYLGQIQSRTSGLAHVLVENGDSSQNVAVKVEIPGEVTNLPPIADPGPDITVRSEERVTLSATNSSDPEGSALTYRWKQVGGRVVIIRKPTEEEVSFVAPKTTTGSRILKFSLTVKDDQRALSLPEVIEVEVVP